MFIFAASTQNVVNCYKAFTVFTYRGWIFVYQKR